MPKNKGISLVEVMLSLALSLSAGLAMLTMVRQFQNWNSNLGLLMERDERLRQAPLLLGRHLTAAGNNSFDADWEGLEVFSEQIIVKSDLEGDEGFPDATLDGQYESIALRRQGDDLQLRSGGGRFQPLLKNIRGFEVTDWRPPLIQLRLEAETSAQLRDVGEKAVEQVELAFYVWNYRKNLFKEGRR